MIQAAIVRAAVVQAPSREETRKERDRHIEWERRDAVEVWYPRAHDLKLLHIPEQSRAHVRRRLAPWLANLTHAMSLHIASWGSKRLGVQGGHCWEIAQGLAMTANDPRVKYVEGVWTRPYQLEYGELPAPHAWVTVDGHHVDLVGELYGWRCEDDEWLYEPLREYTYDDLWKLFANDEGCEGYFPEGWDVSTVKWWEETNNDETILPVHLRIANEPEFTRLRESEKKNLNRNFGTPEEHVAWDKFCAERDAFISNIVFKSAIDRLIQRYKATAKEAA